MMRLALALALIAAPCVVSAQVVSPAPVDPAGLATKADVAAIQSAMPVPADAIPPVEVPSGAAGSTSTYRRGDAVQPRITRAGGCTMQSGGVCTITWTPALPSAANPPNVIFTPINATAQPIICNLTATPTATSASVRCWTTQTTTLSLSIVTTGLSLAPSTATAAGVVVQVTALPATQATQ